MVLSLSLPPPPPGQTVVCPSLIGSHALSVLALFLIGLAKILPYLIGSHISNQFLACSLLITLMMKAVITSETSVNFYQITWHNILEDRHLLSEIFFSCSELSGQGLYLVYTRLMGKDHMHDSASFYGDIQQLRKALRQNGYTAGDTHQALNPRQKSHSHCEKAAGVETITYMHATSNGISRFLARLNKRTVHMSSRKNVHLLRSMKADLGHKMYGPHH
jgi:hypothetical protein